MSLLIVIACIVECNFACAVTVRNPMIPCSFDKSDKLTAVPGGTLYEQQ